MEMYFELVDASYHACSLCGRSVKKTSQTVISMALQHIKRHHFAIDQPFLVKSKGLKPHFTTVAHGYLTIHEIGA